MANNSSLQFHMILQSFLHADVVLQKQVVLITMLKSVCRNLDKKFSGFLDE